MKVGDGRENSRRAACRSATGTMPSDLWARIMGGSLIYRGSVNCLLVVLGLMSVFARR